MRRIIEAARDGKSILEFPVYDGSETGEKIYNTLTVIGNADRAGRQAAGRRRGQDPGAGQADALAGDDQLFRAGKSAKEEAGEQTPVYAISFELYENGISRALVLDYSDFGITGEMTSLEMKKVKPCPQGR